MNRFLVYLLILFVAIFVFQHSHVVEKVKVFDRRIGVEREEYRFHWSNLISYIAGLPQQASGFFEGVSDKIKSLFETPKRKRKKW